MPADTGLASDVPAVEHPSTRPYRIVAGYDGSDASARALDTAAGLVGYGTTLTVVSVRAAGAGHELADAARERLQARHVEARYDERTGDPAEQLLAAARDQAADLVVIAGSSHSPGPRTLGSVSSLVVQRAPCAVLVVR